MDDLFYEIYNDLPRQGPGDAECTRRAFQSLPDPSAIHRILDVGCGAGLQTLEFARLSTADVVAADNNPVVIETLSRRVNKGGDRPLPASFGLLRLCVLRHAVPVLTHRIL